MGHEVAHINKRHSIKMLGRNLAGYLFISAVFTDVNGIIAVLGDNIHSLNNLSYSRKFGREADLDAFEIMKNNSINPKGLTRLFERIQKKQEDYLPEFLSTHPVTKERIEFINLLIDNNRFVYKNFDEINVLFSQLK